MKRRLPILAMICLAGCDIVNQRENLDVYLSVLEKQSAKTLEPLPRFQPSAVFVYSASELPDPFQPGRSSLQGEKTRQSVSAPDTTRTAEYLEQFDLDALEMVGSLSDRQRTLAIIRAGNAVFPVGLGQYLGRHHGRVIAIDEAKVDVVEIVPDLSGGWVERFRTLLIRSRS